MDGQPQKGVVCLPDSHLRHLTDNTITVLLMLFEGNVTSKKDLMSSMLQPCTRSTGAYPCW